MPESVAVEIWLDTWRATHPQFAPAWIFLRDHERTRYGAFEALKQEWQEAVYAIHEPQVAATKLQWWREELRLARDGGARHPLSAALFADRDVRALSAKLWDDAIDAALRSIETIPASDFSAQCAQTQPLQGALARIETALWFGANADSTRAQRIAVITHLINALRHLPQEIAHGRSPLPMSLLARHGLTQAGLGDDSPTRSAAVRHQAQALRQALEEAVKLDGPLSLFRAVQSHIDTLALRCAAAAVNPLQALQQKPGGVRNVFMTWRAARVWRKAQNDENPHAAN